jgi:hypothetical protein
VPKITQTYTPKNRPTIIQNLKAFKDITAHDLDTGRYLGPFSKLELEESIGPFQSSPLSLVPKAHKPDKHRLVQNLSFPHDVSMHRSINSVINSNDFPCTWGTFQAFSLLCARLPPGSQGAVRDVAEAYRTVLLHPSQWPGTIVRDTGEDNFMLDGNLCFGITSGAGCYGHIADAGADIMRARGVGPVAKWVDDHVFLRIRCKFLDIYNIEHREQAAKIERHGGAQQSGGRIWFNAGTMDDGRLDEHMEDMLFPLQDLSGNSECTVYDKDFTYSFSDINEISRELGIPWQMEKDIPFTHKFPFTGFLWDLERYTVSIPEKKKHKYLDAITLWSISRTHTLEEVQKLYGKLWHVSLVVPEGRAYLTNLESMLRLYGDRPFMPRTPPRQTPADLIWWHHTLSQEHVERPIPGPCTLYDPQGYSDASSETGIAIVIAGHWRAWHLLPGWKSDGRDIAWAEAIGFELLVKTLLRFGGENRNIKVFGDNRTVVEGWWNGRSRNHHVNVVFRRIHAHVREAHSTIHTRYVESTKNPADDPSCGRYPPDCLLLPPIKIGSELDSFLMDWDIPPNSNLAQCSKPKRLPMHRAPPPSDDSWSNIGSRKFW